MADKYCNRGHLIDELWDICPYCPSPSEERPMAVSRSTGERSVSGRHRASGGYDAGNVPPPQRTVAAPILEQPDAPHPRYVIGWLLGLTDGIRGEAFPVRIGRNIIGRSRKSDIVVPDEMASSHHADLIFRPDERRYILMDHNSTNGTYVNGREIEPRRDLVERDIVRIGMQKYLFVTLYGGKFDWDEQVS